MADGPDEALTTMPRTSAGYRGVVVAAAQGSGTMSDPTLADSAEALAKEHCHEIPPGTPALREAEVASLRTAISAEWQLGAEGQALERTFRRPDFASAFGLATRVALLAEREQHHPDLEIGWGRLKVRLSTHSVGGLSRNDFILAARIDRLVAT